MSLLFFVHKDGWGNYVYNQNANNCKAFNKQNEFLNEKNSFWTSVLARVKIYPFLRWMSDADDKGAQKLSTYWKEMKRPFVKGWSLFLTRIAYSTAYISKTFVQTNFCIDLHPCSTLLRPRLHQGNCLFEIKRYFALT